MDIINQFFDINVIKFGEFLLKSGVISPIYIDIREIISYPKLMNRICDLIYEKMCKKVDNICGVPYTALPMASIISGKYDVPMVMKRKESKDYGTKKLIEGVFKKDMTCCIIEDIITTGSSIIETAKELENVGLRVSEAVVIIDRNQGARANLKNHGINVISLFELQDVLKWLLSAGKISREMYERSADFIKHSQVAPEPKIHSNVVLSFDERIAQASNAVTRRLMRIIQRKKTKVCVAADVKTMGQLLTLAGKVAPFICMLKLHTDTIDDFNLTAMAQLKQLSLDTDFILMEDRKFADIGNTTKLQIGWEHFDYLSWCDLITVHAVAGDGVLDAIRSAAREREVEVGCVIVAEMSCKGAWSSAEYKAHCANMAEQNSDIVAGFVSQSPVRDNLPGFIHCTPGVKLSPGTDSLGQNYRSIEDLKHLGFIDVFIVGRGITESESPDRESSLYRDYTFQ